MFPFYDEQRDKSRRFDSIIFEDARVQALFQDGLEAVWRDVGDPTALRCHLPPAEFVRTSMPAA